MGPSPPFQNWRKTNSQAKNFEKTDGDQPRLFKTGYENQFPTPKSWKDWSGANPSFQDLASKPISNLKTLKRLTGTNPVFSKLAIKTAKTVKTACKINSQQQKPWKDRSESNPSFRNWLSKPIPNLKTLKRLIGTNPVFSKTGMKKPIPKPKSLKRLIGTNPVFSKLAMKIRFQSQNFEKTDRDQNRLFKTGNEKPLPNLQNFEKTDPDQPRLFKTGNENRLPNKYLEKNDQDHKKY